MKNYFILWLIFSLFTFNLAQENQDNPFPTYLEIHTEIVEADEQGQILGYKMRGMMSFLREKSNFGTNGCALPDAFLHIVVIFQEKGKMQVDIIKYDKNAYFQEKKKIELSKDTHYMKEYECKNILLGKDTKENPRWLYARIKVDIKDYFQQIKDPQNLRLELKNFHILDMEKNKILHQGSVTGEIVFFDIENKALFELGLKPFEGAKKIGVIEQNVISLYSQNWTAASYKIIAENAILPGKYWLWVRQTASENTGAIGTKNYK